MMFDNVGPSTSCSQAPSSPSSSNQPTPPSQTSTFGWGIISGISSAASYLASYVPSRPFTASYPAASASDSTVTEEGLDDFTFIGEEPVIQESVGSHPTPVTTPTSRAPSGPKSVATIIQEMQLNEVRCVYFKNIFDSRLNTSGVVHVDSGKVEMPIDQIPAGSLAQYNLTSIEKVTIEVTKHTLSVGHIRTKIITYYGCKLIGDLEGRTFEVTHNKKTYSLLTHPQVVIHVKRIS